MKKKIIVFYTLGPVITGLLGTITLPALAWLFSKNDIGKIAMLQVVCSFSTLLFSLGLDQAYVREYHETKQKSGLFCLSLTPGLVSLLIVLAISSLFKSEIVFFICDEKIVDYFFLITFSIISSFLLRFFSLVLRMRENALFYSLSQITPKVIFLVCIILLWGLSLEKNLYNLLSINLYSLVLTLCILIGLTKSELVAFLSWEIPWEKLKQMVDYGFPLIFGGVAFWGLSAMSRIFLRNLADFSELGIYSVALSIAGIASLLQNVFSTIWAPTVFKWAANGENLAKIDVISEYILAFVVFSFSICGLFSWVIPYLLPPGYEQVQFLVVACVGQYLFYALSEVTSIGINITRKTFFAMLAPVLAVAMNYFFCIYFIPIYGGRGAAISTFLSFLAFFILKTEGAAFAWRNFPRRKIYFFVSLILFATILTVIGSSSLFYYSLMSWFLILILGIFLFYHLIKRGIYYFWNFLVGLSSAN